MFIDLLRKRRSVRQFTDQPIEEEKITLLQEAALRSPSSRSRRPWEFVFVTDRTLCESLAHIKPHGASFVREAALAVVVLGDEKSCDVWVEDCSIASIFLQLEAEDLGLKSCWVQVRERMFDEKKTAEEAVRELVGAPDHLRVLSIVAIGYPAEFPKGHAASSLKREKIHLNTYGA